MAAASIIVLRPSRLDETTAPRHSRAVSFLKTDSMDNSQQDDAPTSTQAPETVYVDRTRVSCDGGGGALGHPLVWYSLDDGDAACGYCDRKFIYDPEKAKAI